LIALIQEHLAEILIPLQSEEGEDEHRRHSTGQCRELRLLVESNLGFRTERKLVLILNFIFKLLVHF
jgi:hypothetical protein